MTTDEIGRPAGSNGASAAIGGTDPTEIWYEPERDREPVLRRVDPRGGDMTEVSLAADVTFRGPVASFDEPGGFRQMAAGGRRGTQLSGATPVR
jgi:hypothetical protein